MADGILDEFENGNESSWKRKLPELRIPRNVKPF